MAFINQSGKDPRRGIEKGLKGCQDRLLDVLGPLTKIFDMCEAAHSNNTGIDVAEMRQWVQRAICLLGNLNTALCIERRKSILFKIDPKLADLASKELGECSDGLLFGDDFVKDMSRYVSTFSSLEKAQ